MRRLAYTSLVLAMVLGSGCYQRTLAPEVTVDDADVQAFRSDMGIEAAPASSLEVDDSEDPADEPSAD